MKKSVRIVCSLFVLVSLSLFAVFALSPDEQVSAEASRTIDGTWRVFTNVSNGQVTLVENEFMVFDAGQAVDYRNGEKYVASSYSVDGELLSLPDIKQSYHIAAQSENCMRLYQADSTFLQLVRAPGLAAEEYELSTDILTGKWDITYRLKDNPNMLEQLGFEGDTIYVYRNGSPDPVMHATWTANEQGWLCVAAMAKEMRLYKINDTSIVMVQQAGDVGFVWELTPVAE